MKQIWKIIIVALVIGAAVSQPAFSQRPPSSSSRYSIDEAVALVKKKTDGRVLRAETLRRDERTVYRIRILTADGDIRTINVDAEEGIQE